MKTRLQTHGRRGAVAGTIACMVAALPLAAAPAGADVTGGQSIEVFTGSNLVSLTGYPANSQVEVEVLRQGFVIGQAVKTSDADGAIEMNHTGDGDCFDGPTSPDIVPGDTMRTTVVGTDNVDTSVVRGVFIDDVSYGATSITVSGHVSRRGPTAVAPGTDVLELRFRKPAPNREWDDPTIQGDLRVDIGGNVNPDGSWTRTIQGSAQDVNEHQNGGETVLEWSAGAANEEEFPPELTVAEFGPGEELVGCPPLQQGPSAPALARAMDSGKKGDHITNRSTNLTFSGLTEQAGPGATARLMVDGAQVAEVVANGRGVYSFTGISLAEGAHVLTVQAQGDGAPFDSAARSVTVDTAAPAVRVRAFRPNPLHLRGPERLHAVYRVGERSLLQVKVQSRSPLRTVQTFRNRNLRRAGLAEYNWNGKNEIRRDVRRGRYQMVLTATDRAGNRTVQRNTFRVAR